MIHLTSGNLLHADVDALVNAVNTVGVAGKGIALQFRLAFPESHKAYVAAAKARTVTPGQMLVVQTGAVPKYIIHFPTKRHWKDLSRIGDIELGLQDLAQVIAQYAIRSIAVPALGCGNGGLEWSQVRPLVESALGSVDAKVLLFQPTDLA
jgi:O-acetyl-ADP-ribose deacetylase (regulator of RNase III)